MVNENLIDKLIDRTGWENHMWETGRNYDLNNDKERSEFYSIYDTLSLEDVLETKKDTNGLSESEAVLEKFIKDFDNYAYDLYEKREEPFYDDEYSLRYNEKYGAEYGELPTWTLFLDEIKNDWKNALANYDSELADYLANENRLSVVFDEIDRAKEWEEDAWDFELNNIMNYQRAGEEYYG